MCHISVMWHHCDHLIPSDSLCPYRNLFDQHVQGEATTNRSEEDCFFCKKPGSIEYNVMKNNQVTASQLAKILELQHVGDDKLQKNITKFFEKRRHRNLNQPDTEADNAKDIMEIMMVEYFRDHPEMAQDVAQGEESNSRANGATEAQDSSSNQDTDETQDTASPVAHQEPVRQDTQEQTPASGATSSPQEPAQAQRVSHSPSVQLVSPVSARAVPVTAEQGDGSAQSYLAAARQPPPISAQQGVAAVQPAPVAPVAPVANESISVEDLNLFNAVGQWCRENGNAPQMPQVPQVQINSPVQNAQAQGSQAQYATQAPQVQMPTQNGHITQMQNGQVHGAQSQHHLQVPMAHNVRPRQNVQMPTQNGHMAHMPRGFQMQNAQTSPNAHVQHGQVPRNGQAQSQKSLDEQTAAQFYYAMLGKGLVSMPSGPIDCQAAAQNFKSMVMKGLVPMRTGAEKTPAPRPVQARPAQTPHLQVPPVPTLPVQAPPVQARPAQVPHLQAPPVPTLPVQTPPVSTPHYQDRSVQTSPIQAWQPPLPNPQFAPRFASQHDPFTQSQYVQPQEVDLQPNQQVQDDQLYDMINFDPEDTHTPLPSASPTAPLSGMNSMAALPDQNAATYQSMQPAPAEIDSPLFSNIQLSALDQLNIDQMIQPEEASAMIDRAIDQANIHGSGRSSVSSSDIQQISTSSSSRNKGKGKSRRRKSKTGPTPSIVIIDKLDTDNRSQRSGSGSSSGFSSSRRTGIKTVPSSDPTRGVSGPNSRVTKRTSSSSSARTPSQSPPSATATNVQDPATNGSLSSSGSSLGDTPLDIDMLLDDDLFQRDSEFAKLF